MHVCHQRVASRPCHFSAHGDVGRIDPSGQSMYENTVTRLDRDITQGVAGQRVSLIDTENPRRTVLFLAEYLRGVQPCIRRDAPRLVERITQMLPPRCSVAARRAYFTGD